MDYNLGTNGNLRGTGALAADETLTEVALQPMINPLYLHTRIPSVSSGDKFAVKVVFKDASDNVLLTLTGPDYTTKGNKCLEIFCDHPDLAKLVITNDVTLDSTAAGSFGTVEQYFSTARTS